MPSVGATRLLAIHEEPDMSVEAVVAAAIRLHEWVETSLRRLATGAHPVFEQRGRSGGVELDLVPARTGDR